MLESSAECHELESTRFRKGAKQAFIPNVALSRSICKDCQNNEGTINAITLEPELEQTVQASIQRTEQGSFLTIDPNLDQEILRAIGHLR